MCQEREVAAQTLSTGLPLAGVEMLDHPFALVAPTSISHVDGLACAQS
jgi:hypothetical protein